MATDLPSRPTPNPDDTPRPVDPTERVKSVSDKTDPRFAAALERADREARIRAKAAGRPVASPDGDGADDEPEPEVEPTDAGSFSFNQTAGSTEEDQ